MLKSVFWIDKEDRQRAAWRILTTLAVVAGMIMGAHVITTIALGGLPEDPTRSLLVRNLVVALAGTLGLYIARTHVDKKSFRSLGLDYDQTALKDFGLGLFISFSMIAVFFILQITLGLITIKDISLGAEGGTSVSNLILAFFGLGIFISWFEECLFRGAIYQNMEEGLGLKYAVLASCLLYGLIYYPTANASLLGGIIIILLGGLRLFAYLRTRRLWFSMGLSASWNFCLLAFGYSISNSSLKGAVDHMPQEPIWLSGGVYGPEASLMIIPFMLLAAAVIMWWSEDRQPKPQSEEKDIEPAPTSAP